MSCISTLETDTGDQPSADFSIDNSESTDANVANPPVEMTLSLENFLDMGYNQPQLNPEQTAICIMLTGMRKPKQLLTAFSNSSIAEYDNGYNGSPWEVSL